MPSLIPANCPCGPVQSGSQRCYKHQPRFLDCVASSLPPTNKPGAPPEGHLSVLSVSPVCSPGHRACVALGVLSPRGPMRWALNLYPGQTFPTGTRRTKQHGKGTLA
ncbi:hypothetical protein KIL84_006128 [Mauremys mutica]|uniref:Uncharacterized protein n=1 Tax=Mauremys mutica TaxID=74926 RepID=A0A9D3XHM7_9SAUR|nr:hypothetical protein KIL84_006128 [Mauremys mutica]